MSKDISSINSSISKDMIKKSISSLKAIVDQHKPYSENHGCSGYLRSLLHELNLIIADIGAKVYKQVQKYKSLEPWSDDLIPKRDFFSFISNEELLSNLMNHQVSKKIWKKIEREFKHATLAYLQALNLHIIS